MVGARVWDHLTAQQADGLLGHLAPVPVQVEVQVTVPDGAPAGLPLAVDQHVQVACRRGQGCPWLPPPLGLLEAPPESQFQDLSRFAIGLSRGQRAVWLTRAGGQCGCTGRGPLTLLPPLAAAFFTASGHLGHVQEGPRPGPPRCRCRHALTSTALVPSPSPTDNLSITGPRLPSRPPFCRHPLILPSAAGLAGPCPGPALPARPSFRTPGSQSSETCFCVSLPKRTLGFSRARTLPPSPPAPRARALWPPHQGAPLSVGQQRRPALGCIGHAILYYSQMVASIGFRFLRTRLPPAFHLDIDGADTMGPAWPCPRGYRDE